MKFLRNSVSLIAIAFSVLFAAGQFRTVDLRVGSLDLLLDRGMIRMSISRSSPSESSSGLWFELASGNVVCSPGVNDAGDVLTVDAPHWLTVFSSLVLTLLVGRLKRCRAPRQCPGCGATLDERSSNFCPRCGFSVAAGSAHADVD
ncbi:MAG TPA: hypothetical protein P5081_02465 [Phycisphaerae bacterium]|nr:hypothetical protein [Phycisphaerae bacterium]HRW51720.1 hypothetical protein [Phycisphaerae bacterium]